MPTRLRIPPALARRLANKQADLGGPGNDNSFEQSFASLATAYLTDKAPSLLAYEVGFQLVERDEDNNKAVGLFGFKAGPLWLYAPVFFVAGDLKGHELLFIKNQNQFVPLEEGWINHLLAKRPVELGDSVNRSGRQQGIRYPDLQRALQGPMKYASLSSADRKALQVEAAAVMTKAGAAGAPLRGLPDWAQIGVAAIVKAASEDRPAASMSLLDLIADGGIKMATALATMLTDFPTLRHGFDAFYAADAVKTALLRSKTASSPRPRYRPALVGGSILATIEAEDRHRVFSKVAVHQFDGDWNALSPLLEASERTTLITQGMLVKDARADDEVSAVYNVDLQTDFAKIFSNPDASGFYRVLTKDGGLEDCLIVLGPYDGTGRQSFATVVRLDGKKKDFLNVHPSYVWSVRIDDSPTGNVGGQEGGHWFDELPDVEPRVEDDAYYIAVGRGGAASTPFRIEGDAGADAGGGHAYRVFFDRYATRGHSIANHAAGIAEQRQESYRIPGDSDRVHLGQRTGTKLRSNHGDLYVPAEFKLIRLAPDEDNDGDGDPGMSKGVESLRLGDALSVQYGLLQKTAGLEVQAEGAFARIGDRAMTRKAACVELITRHGLRETDALAMLETAETTWKTQRKAASFRVKYADPYMGDPYLTSGAPTAPGVLDPPPAPDGTFGAQTAAYGPFEQEYPVSDLVPGYGNQDSYAGEPQPDPMMAQVAMQAQQTGQREVFDTAMIGSLLKTTSDDGLVDRYMKNLMKALDDMGRLLFNFYWHGERFAERYGEDDMPELEDSLRNTFEALGKVILFLRRKTTVAVPDEDAQSEDLDETADL